MIYGLVLIVHVIVSLLLVAIILVQGGRGGMAEALGGSGAQSLFGGGANVVMTKVTALGAGIFLVTCLVLAKLSADRGRSIIDALPAASGVPLTDAGAGVPEVVLPGVIPAPLEDSATPAPPSSAPAPETSTPAQ